MTDMTPLQVAADCERLAMSPGFQFEHVRGAFAQAAHTIRAQAAEIERLREALKGPQAWTQGEADMLRSTFMTNQGKRGLTETLFAVAKVAMQIAAARAALGGAP